MLFEDYFIDEMAEIIHEHNGIQSDKTLSIEEDSIRIRGLLVEAQKEQKQSVNDYNKSLQESANLLDNSAEAMKKLIKPTQDLNSA